MADATKLDKVEHLMRLFWGEKIVQTTDVHGLAVEALDCAERGGSPNYLVELLADMQVESLKQSLNETACETIAAKIRELVGDAGEDVATGA